MTTAAPDHPAVHPRTRPAKIWRSRLGQLTAAGVAEDDPRVIETRAALSWHRTRSFLTSEFGEERRDALMDVIFP
ncbi:hypothetical protein [Mycobacteroides abscessus]|uniref:hypothetical protein n=1 Tax=Mycobacteroides abscessus TaxID=36809 RepID=UPI0009A6BDE2|nr:hypothetical protein [Mycobacteroides abscessus]RIS72244.1 hypothetical protein D2E70_04800 [Mycobacteroides abscessus]SLG45881.1 Uncharacterised protein [Mycobacteroides abscessus subsp. massiliense]